MPKSVLASGLTIIALAQGGCSSDSSDGPTIQAFQASGCKSIAMTPSAGDGRCVAWSTTAGGNLAFTLSDFVELCGVPESKWKAQAGLAGGTLTLAVTWDFATPNACGECVQDFSFAVARAKTADTKRIRVETKGCAGDCGPKAYLIDLGTAGMAAQGSFCGEAVAKL
jgi:hypothetical protein